jgi:cell division protein FtsB
MPEQEQTRPERGQPGRPHPRQPQQAQQAQVQHQQAQQAPPNQAPAEPAPQSPQSPAQAAAIAAASRSTRLTGRAALLAVVICAIALSLAYPVREYIAQRQQIDQLQALQQTIATQVKALQEENVKLSQTWYIEQQAEDQLHMCFPQQQCYVVVSGQPAKRAPKPQPAADPWYAKLWQSVQRADAEPSK